MAMTSRPKHNLKLATHYIIFSTEPSQLGATRLYKALWFADLEHQRRYGRSLTGLTHYVRKQNGPIPVQINATLEELKRSNAIAERKSAVYDYPMREFIWLSEPDVSNLSAEQIKILHKSLSYVCSLSASELSEKTHTAYWDELENGEQMDVAAASLVLGEVTDEDIQWATNESQYAE